MERKELLEAAKEAGIVGGHKMKTEELEAALAEIKDSEAKIAEETAKEVKVAKKAKTRAEMTPGERARLVKADLMRKERVIVMDKQRQYLTDDGESPSVRISFRLGQLRHAMTVETNQEPQFLPRGIIQVMQDMNMDSTYQEVGKSTVDSVKFNNSKRFVITPAPELTEKEIEDQKARESARKK